MLTARSPGKAVVITASQFHLEVDVEEWVRRVGNAGQQRVDQIVTLLRQHIP